MMLIPDTVVEFAHADREAFRSGRLREEWAYRYPQLFDEDDLRIARAQPDYHFYEWYSAVHIFEKHGFFSLVEQYQFLSHKRKQLVIKQLMSPALVQFIAGGSTQAPDLVVYSPDFRKWDFYEVKGPNDRVSARQKDHFSHLETISGHEVHILKLRQRIEVDKAR